MLIMCIRLHTPAYYRGGILTQEFKWRLLCISNVYYGLGTRVGGGVSRWIISFIPHNTPFKVIVNVTFVEMKKMPRVTQPVIGGPTSIPQVPRVRV